MSKAAKGGKGRSKKAHSVFDTSLLAPTQRLLTLRLDLATGAGEDAAATAAVPRELVERLIVKVSWDGQESVLWLRDGVEPEDTSPEPARFLLWTHVLEADMATLERLCAGAAASRVDVFLPHVEPEDPSGAGEGGAAAAATGGAGKAGKKSGAAAPPAAAPKSKAKNAATEPRCGEHLCGTDFSLIDIMSTPARVYEMRRDDAAAGGETADDAAAVARAAALRLESSSPLLSVSDMLSMRPALLTITGADGLPPVPEVKTASGVAEAELELTVECFGKCFTLPRLAQRLAERDAAHRQRQREGAAQPHRGALLRALFFLGASDPLTVYRQSLQGRLRASLTLRGGERVALPVGAGQTSLRDYALSGQTFFSEVLQMTPARSAAAARETCLSTACSVTLTLDLFHPLPRVEHVDAEGGPGGRRLMTRGVFIMPYEAEWTEDVLEALIRGVVQHDRATLPERDVQLYVEPPPPRPFDDDDETDGPIPLASPGAGGKKNSKSKRSNAGANRHGGSLAGAGGNGAGEPTDAKKSAFEEPFRVVSPDGIGGFEVSDGEVRIVCLEGPVSAVHQVLQRMAVTADCDLLTTLLLNAELFVPQRWYSTFPPLVTLPERFAEMAAAEEAEAAPAATHKSAAGKAASPSKGGGGAKGTAAAASPSAAAATPRSNGTGGPSSASSNPSTPRAVTDEADASGTGGRLHRVRLREGLRALASQQQFFLRRALSESCLNCVLKLNGLLSCETLRDAAARDLFPTAADIISLERSFGQTLSLTDVFGRPEFVNVGTTAAAATTRRAARLREERERELATVPEVNLRALRPADAGRLASFEGVLVPPSDAPPVPPQLRQRYRVLLWMRAADGTQVLCVFPRGTPGATIRYRMEGQVVEFRDHCALYVMEFHSLAHSSTHSRNPAFEAVLKARSTAERDRAATRLLRDSADRSALPGASASGRVVAPPFAEPTEGGQRAGAAPPGGDSTDDDSDDDARNPPPCGADDLTVSGTTRLTSSIGAAGSGAAAAGGVAPPARTGPALTRSDALRSRFVASKREAAAASALTNEELWEMYDKRAPRRGPAPAVTQPVMHF